MGGLDRCCCCWEVWSEWSAVPGPRLLQAPGSRRRCEHLRPTSEPAVWPAPDQSLCWSQSPRCCPPVPLTCSQLRGDCRLTAAEYVRGCSICVWLMLSLKRGRAKLSSLCVNMFALSADILSNSVSEAPLPSFLLHNQVKGCNVNCVDVWSLYAIKKFRPKFNGFPSAWFWCCSNLSSWLESSDLWFALSATSWAV